RDIPDHLRVAATRVAELCGAAMERVVLSDDARRTDTLLTRSAKRLATLETTTLFATARSGPDRVDAVNARMLDLLGLDRLPDGGVPWNALSAPQHAVADARALARALAGDGPVRYEKHLSTGDGRDVPVLASLVASGSDEVTGVFRRPRLGQGQGTGGSPAERGHRTPDSGCATGAAARHSRRDGPGTGADGLPSR
ncbi:MAG: hypothetical protein ACRCSN_08010, partial [Dermatophilaceae bacterium]